MKKQVTIIPADKLIIADGVGYELDFSAPENIHAIQWQGDSGHCEYTDARANKELTAEDYEAEIAPYVALWEAEKVRLEEEQAKAEEEYNKPENVRSRALSRIDSATSAAILAGFEHEVETEEGKEVLHFSYLADDQQNFADTANGAILAMQGVEGLPTAVKWNGWRNHTAEYKGDLVRLVLDVQTFLGLYTGGALVHKVTQMEIGGQRKAAIEAAETVEEINALLEGWGI